MVKERLEYTGFSVRKILPYSLIFGFLLGAPLSRYVNEMYPEIAQPIIESFGIAYVPIPDEDCVFRASPDGVEQKVE